VSAPDILKPLNFATPLERAQILSVLKEKLQHGQTKVQKRFEDGAISALEAATELASAHDVLVVTIFNYADQVLFPGTNPKQASQISICAVGGYGRGELAPFSDLDLLFLHSKQADEKRCAQITEYVLYMLWDLGLKIGHGMRTPAQCISLGRVDETILTTLLDLRFLSGGRDPAIHLVELLRQMRTRSAKRKFIRAKLSARDARHNRAGNSRYVIEPNVKEGKGGLRDLHELYWIARFVHGTKSAKNDPARIPDKPHGVEAYLRHGLLDAKAGKRFGDAAEFLWKVRFNLHYKVGRAAEVLSFDRQAAIARRMGYHQVENEQLVEAFMHTYFKTTREVGALTRIACTKLESQSALLLPQGLDRLLPTSRRGLKQKGFVLEHGRLNFSSLAGLKKKPIDILKLFEIAGVRNLDIHPDAFFIISQNLNLIDDKFRGNAEAADVFFDILLQTKAPGATLRTMNEAGVLGAYIPEFGSIVGRTQFNMHHAYTVDDHTLSLIGFVHDLESGRFAREHAVSSKFIKSWTRRLRLCVYLACLLHDTGKGKGDQCVEGAVLARNCARRLGLEEADTDTVAWLVRNHLEMSETAQRRDLSNLRTIEVFAGKIGSVTRLQMLAVLTIVDIRAVGPGIWNDWKGELLRELYTKTAQKLMGETARRDEEANEIDEQIKTLPPHALQGAHAVFVSCDRQKDITAAWVLTRDRQHLFAALTGAIANRGASIVGARLHTDESGRVLNVFYLQNAQGLAYGRQNDSKLQKLQQAVLQATTDKTLPDASPDAPPSRRAGAIPIHPRVAVIKDGRGQFIIEIEGRDRPGLLYGLSRVLGQHSLSVRSAHIEVAGPKAVDVFYVSTLASGKRSAPFDQHQLRDDLLTLLTAPAKHMK